MFHNTLYRFERNQKKTLNLLGFAFLMTSIFWLTSEILDLDLPLEPIVVFNGGLATLFASFWPWRASNKFKGTFGRVKFDYTSNSGDFEIGADHLQFTLRFSKRSGESIYIYRDPENIEAIALAANAGRISDIRDASCFDYSSRSLVVEEGQIVALKNQFRIHALIHIHDIMDASHGDVANEVTFSFAINPDTGTDFSWASN